MKKTIIIAAMVLLVAIVIGSGYYTVEENQYACTFRFSEIVGRDEYSVNARDGRDGGV